MKKLMSVLLAMLLVLGCAACAESLSMINPWIDTTNEELGGIFGVPEDAEDVIFRFLGTEGLSEMQFTLDGAHYVARTKPTDAFEDISGMYYGFNGEEEITIDGNETWEGAAEEDDQQIKVIMWHDAAQKASFSLSATAAKDAEIDIDTVRGLVFPTAVGMINPWVGTDAEGFMEALGMTVAIPEGAENVAYRLMGDLGEAQFTLDGMDYTARIKPAADFEDISGMYYEWESDESVTIGGCEGTEARVRDGDTTVDVCLWFDAAPGIMYSLSTKGADLDGFDLTAVAEMIYAPVQGDA